MINQLLGSAILLVFLGVLFSIPLITLSLSAHGVVPALIAGLLVLVSVFIGPLSFVFADSIVTDLELTLILIFGAALFLAWGKALVSEPGYWVPYLPVTGWALMGAYFCVLQLFAHAT
jgi:hypothetical protein